MDEVNRSKAATEKQNKHLTNSLNDINKKVDSMNLSLSDMELSKRKLEAENADLLHQLHELQIGANMLNTANQNLRGALDEQNQVCADEGRGRSSLLSKYRNLEHEFESLRNQLEDEMVSRESVHRKTEAAVEEVAAWRRRWEASTSRAEELDTAKLRLQARLAEAEATMETLQGKLQQLETGRARAGESVAEMATNLDRAQTLNTALEKKAKQFDIVVGEWKHKVEDLALELDGAQKDTRNTATELFRVKTGYEEAVLQLDGVRTENKKLSAEIRDLMEQITDGGRSIHEIDKVRKRLESEIVELESALTDAEAALEQEEGRVARLQQEVAGVRQEIERRLADKEEEFQGSRKQMARALESLQGVLEVEAKSKAEVMRTRKKLDADVKDLETSLEHATAAGRESQRSIASLVAGLKALAARTEAEAAARAELQDQLLAAERRVCAHRSCVEEARALLDQTDRARRQLEAELADTQETLGEQSCTNQALGAAVRRGNTEVAGLSVSVCIFHDLTDVNKQHTSE